MPTSELAPWVPHRPPMVWVDTVNEVNQEGGICRVILKENALYFAEHGVLQSAPIEWMAQAYAFVRVCQFIRAKRRFPSTPTRAYLASLKDVRWVSGWNEQIGVGSELCILVRHLKELGPISMVAGAVQTRGGLLLTEGQFKIFAE